MTTPTETPSAYRLRPAIEADQKTIRALIRSVGINPMGLDWPRFWVAVDSQDRIVGCAQVKEHGDGARELASVAVRPAWRGRGVAADLVRHLLDLHGPTLWLTCRSSLVDYYARFGFREVDEDREMPRLLRRVRRLMNGVFRLLPKGEYLAVMAWSGG